MCKITPLASLFTNKFVEMKLPSVAPETSTSFMRDVTDVALSFFMKD
jgi:hypothetical protein